MTTDVSQAPSMDYSKKTRDELIAIFKEKGIKGYSGKNKGVLVELLTKKSIHANKVQYVDITQVSSVKEKKKDLNWYKIDEINIETFLGLIKPLYDIIEGKKVSKSEPDPFAQEAWKSFYNMTTEKWTAEHKKIQNERAWTMAWGDFHQNIMGSFQGWDNYNKGHITGCDIGKKDGTSVVEVKNNTNTMNSSSKETVFKKLKKQHDLGKRAILVIINGDVVKCVKDGIEIISGRQFYEELSGRASFMDDLLKTINKAFGIYKSYETLKLSLEIS